VSFYRALPDTILLEPSQRSLKADLAAYVTSTASLRRAVGTVTAGTPVTFTAIRANGSNIESLGVPTVSDANGTVTVRFTPTDLTYQGVVTIIGRVASAKGGVVTGQTAVTIIP
jgi:hypothetical protein